MTYCAHLARALVHEGQEVQRGEPIAISGYSGVDALVTFPFGVPHVHFNTWLNGEPVDPFARVGEVSLWRGGRPTPGAQDETLQIQPSAYDEAKVDAIIASCKTPSVRADLAGITHLAQRAAQTLIAKNYYPTRFDLHQSPYADHFERKEVFQVPFQKSDFDEVVFLDEI